MKADSPIRLEEMSCNAKKYSAPAATCPADCPGRHSFWHPALGEAHNCPLGIPFCGAWNPDMVIIKPAKAVSRNKRKTTAA